jgi:hypothetical protein
MEGSQLKDMAYLMPIGKKSAMQELSVSHAALLGLLFCMAQHSSREVHNVDQGTAAGCGQGVEVDAGVVGLVVLPGRGGHFIEFSVCFRFIRSLIQV